MLFIIQHQTSELWMKLMIHELTAAITHLKQDRLSPCFKILARVKQIQMQLFNQWAVLETLTPTEYLQFRGVLGNSSGFQSRQYRSIEFLLGNKHARMIEAFRHDPAEFGLIHAILQAPSLYDEFLAYLSRRGFAVPADLLTRDFTLPHQRDARLIPVFREVYEHPDKHWDAYEMCEKLIDVEEYFQLWRFRHMKTVERIIGFRPGTGGSSGVGFLKNALGSDFLSGAARRAHRAASGMKPLHAPAAPAGATQLTSPRDSPIAHAVAALGTGSVERSGAAPAH